MMNDKKIAVVFDTNSYRYFIRDTTIEDIKYQIALLTEKEASLNIRALAMPTVGMELMASLSGPGKSDHYEECLKALIAMANHCYVLSENGVRVAPPPYLHISRNFFDVVPPAVELISRNMAGVIIDFKDDYLKAVEAHHFNETFKKLKGYVDEEETRWINEVESCVERVRQEVLKIDPAIDAKTLRVNMLRFIDRGLFEPILSMAIIFSMAESLQRKMSEQEHVAKGYLLPRTFPLSVGFYQWICHRIVADQIDLHSKKSRESRWNWRWDYEVSFLINDYLLNGRKVMLITSDKEMIRMLQKYWYGDRVMDIFTYLQFLGL